MTSIPIDVEMRSEHAESSSTDASNASDAQQQGQINDDSENSRPPAEFRIGEVVYASDQDGLVYSATVRRKLFGVNNQKSVLACMVSSVAEADELLAQEEKPTWHYFVHYHGWNVAWDRWSPASKIFMKSEESKQFAQRLQDEHRKLKDELSGKQKGKKSKKSVSAEVFLTAWKIRMLEIYSDYDPRKQQSPGTNSATENGACVVKTALPVTATLSNKTKQFKDVICSTAELHTELALRKKSLTRLYKHGDLVPLPSTLKRILVDSWENITQCNSVPDIPARVTVRDALDKYLQSKGVEIDSASCVNVPSNTSAGLDDSATSDDSSASKQQWIDMRDGMCQYFDEALPHQLLYAVEMAQLYAMCADQEQPIKSYSQVYGCEHLLRLLTRLPALLLDNASETEVRPILAKLNDFVRFLHKNSSLFTLNYRPLNESELKEKQKLEKTEERKRKRVSDEGLAEKAFRQQKQSLPEKNTSARQTEDHASNAV
jgi:hypothetical protein